MTFQIFWNAYGETILTLITGVLTATGLTAYIGAKVQKWLEKKDRKNEIEKIVKSCVELAQRQEPKLSGSEKYAFAAAKAAQWCDSVGLSVSEAEIEILIETACNGLYKNKQAKTADELIDEVVKASDDAAVEFADAKGGEDDE